jgi:hypothetical protein
MAAPVKAFIDPTGVMWITPTRLLPKTQYQVGVPNKQTSAKVCFYIPPAFDKRMTLFGKMLDTLGNTVRSKIPPPPMGRQLILTFPPIYKEKVQYASSTGQLYPPKAP